MLAGAGCHDWMTTAISKRQKGFGHMTHLTQRLAAAFAEAYKREHPEEDTDQAAPSAEETEAAAIAAFAAAL